MGMKILLLNVAHPSIINEATKLIRQKNSDIKIVLGGVFPTFHWKEIFESNPQLGWQGVDGNNYNFSVRS